MGPPADEVKCLSGAVLHLKKDVTFARLLGWDKGTTVNVSSAEVAFLGPSKESWPKMCPHKEPFASFCCLRLLAFTLT